MTAFGDDLRATIKKKQEQLLAAELIEQRQRHAARREAEETARIAAKVLREIIKPLVEEFYEVMAAASILCAGQVVSGRWPVAGEADTASSLEPPASLVPPDHPAAISDHRPPATGHQCRLLAMGATPGSPHYELRVTATAASARVEVAFECVDATGAIFPEETPTTGHRPPTTDLGSQNRKTFNINATAINEEAVRQWCGGLLKKCGTAMMEKR